MTSREGPYDIAEPDNDMTASLIANARMYAVAPGAIAAWKRMFAWLESESGLALTVIDHAFPALLSELWARDDLGCAFMCGWPYLRYGSVHRVVAAPVPSAAYAQGRPVYRSHFVVHADSAFRTLEDTFGHRFAFTIKDSHSGYNAPRHHLLKHRNASDKPLFGEIVGPLTTPRRMLEAIADGRTDVGPLDSFAYDLLCRHEPELARRTRIIASTELVPMPAFVAARGAPDATVERLAHALLRLGAVPDQAQLRADLCIDGFAAIDPEAWQVAERWAADAERQGFEDIA